MATEKVQAGDLQAGDVFIRGNANWTVVSVKLRTGSKIVLILEGAKTASFHPAEAVEVVRPTRI